MASPLLAIAAAVAWLQLMDRCGTPLRALPSLLCTGAALYFGHRSRLDFQRKPDQLRGNTIAFVGLVLSYVLLAGGLAGIVLPSALRSRRAKSESAAVCNLRRITYAEASYVSKRKEYGNLEGLIEAGLLDPAFNKPIDDYQFSVSASASEYTATAVSIRNNTSSFGYYTTKDGVVRYSTTMTMAPSGMSGKPVE